RAMVAAYPSALHAPCLPSGPGTAPTLTSESPSSYFHQRGAVRLEDACTVRRVFAATVQVAVPLARTRPPRAIDGQGAPGESSSVALPATCQVTSTAPGAHILRGSAAAQSLAAGEAAGAGACLTTRKHFTFGAQAGARASTATANGAHTRRSIGRTSATCLNE